MSNNDQKEILTYTLIIHQAKRNLKVTLNEYCIADSIYHLQNNPKSNVQGWCYASKATLGSYIDVSEQSTHSIITGLIKKGIIEKDSDTRYLRTTQVWYDNVILLKLNSRNLSHTKESLVLGSRKLSQTLKKVEPEAQESLVNKNSNKDINKNSNIYASFKNKINSKSRLLDKAKEKIKARLKTFTEEELLKAIDNFSRDSWNMEHNSSRGVAWFFHTDERIDGFINLVPRETEKKPYFRGDPMVKKYNQLYVIVDGEPKKFVGDDKDIEYK